MINSPSKKIRQRTVEESTPSINLIDESRENVNGLFKKLDLFDEYSREYEKSPHPDNLFKMAKVISPISPSTASFYCEMVLYKNPFHEGAKELMMKIR